MVPPGYSDDTCYSGGAVSVMATPNAAHRSPGPPWTGIMGIIV